MADTVRPVETEELRATRRWLSEFYDQHVAGLRRFLRAKYGVGPPDPEDVAQETFLRLASISPQEIGAIDNPKAFLYRAAENILISAKRRAHVAAAHARSVDLLEAARSDCTPERVLSARDQLDAVEHALRAMPETRRRCFVMHRFDELSFVEIARRSGMSPNGVKGHVERALRDIAANFDAREKPEDLR